VIPAPIYFVVVLETDSYVMFIADYFGFVSVVAAATVRILLIHL
jgi:hypothetical protein